MTHLVDNEYGVEFDEIAVKRVRLHRTDGKWLVEYQRTPRWPLKLDAWWWWNDGSYVEYHDAIARVNDLKISGVVRKTRFQKTKVFEVDQ